MSKLMKALVVALSGALAYGCGCSPCGGLNFADFCSGVFTKGIVDNWCIDMIQDWLREDLFG